MTPLSILLCICSLVILLLSAFLKRITDSRSSLMNCFFSSACLFFAAYQSLSRSKPEWVLMLPFLSMMLFAGRSLGMCWRARKEAELLPHCRLMIAGTATCLVATVAAWTLR